MPECIFCKADYRPGNPCPRCGTDNGAWEQWQTRYQGLGGWMAFMAPGLYLPLLLTALVFPLGVTGVRSLWLAQQVNWPWSLPALLVLTFACLLIALATYEDRDRLREIELLNRVRRGPIRFFGATFRMSAIPAVVTLAMSAWTTIILSRPAPTLPSQNRLEFLLGIVESLGVFSTATYNAMVEILTIGGPISIVALGYASLMPTLVYSSSLALTRVYAKRMNEQVPLPIFLDTAHLSKLVRSEAEQTCSNLGPGLIWEGLERTEDGGIKLTARYRHDRKVLEDLAGKKIDLPVHTKCEVVADPWGRILSIKPKSELQV